MPDAQPRYQLPESATLAEAVAGAERGNPVPLMRQGEPVAAVVQMPAAVPMPGPIPAAAPIPMPGPIPVPAAYAAEVRAEIEESRRFLAQCRADRPRPGCDPDELQARMMRRSGRPSAEHYARVFRVEGMPAEQAEVEARRMVEADCELLARYPAA